MYSSKMFGKANWGYFLHCVCMCLCLHRSKAPLLKGNRWRLNTGSSSFSKTLQESVGKELRLCSASSPSRTCCCSGARHAHSGGPAGWSCTRCRSKEVCGLIRRRRSRLESPWGPRCSWSGGPRPRSLTSAVCFGASRHRRSGTSIRWKTACGPKLCRSHRGDGRDPSGGWWSGICNIPGGRAAGLRGRRRRRAGRGGKPGTGPAGSKKISFNLPPYTDTDIIPAVSQRSHGAMFCLNLK